MRTIFHLCGFALATALGLFATPLALSSETCEDPRPLRMAHVPQKRADLLASQFQPLYRHLEKTLGRPVEVVQFSSYTAVVEGLLAGNVDLADLGPAAYAMAMNRGAPIVAFAAFGGQEGLIFDTSSGYQSVLITRKDRPFDSLEKLRGATVSLTDPASTSGALFPRRAIFSLTGKPLDRFFRRVSFSGSHDRAVESVIKGVTDAAFVSSTRIDEMVRAGKLERDELRILWASEIIPFDPFLYRTKLCRALTDRIRHAFLVDTEPLKPMFDAMRRPRFVPVTDANYREVREIYAEMNP
jgi:phosphonate transport system substrate-binding protein